MSDSEFTPRDKSIQLLLPHAIALDYFRGAVGTSLEAAETTKRFMLHSNDAESISALNETIATLNFLLDTIDQVIQVEIDEKTSWHEESEAESANVRMASQETES